MFSRALSSQPELWASSFRHVGIHELATACAAGYMPRGAMGLDLPMIFGCNPGAAPAIQPSAALFLDRPPRLHRQRCTMLQDHARAVENRRARRHNTARDARCAGDRGWSVSARSERSRVRTGCSNPASSGAAARRFRFSETP